MKTTMRVSLAGLRGREKLAKLFKDVDLDALPEIEAFAAVNLQSETCEPARPSHSQDSPNDAL